MKLFFIIGFLLIIMSNTLLWAGTTGKIAGVVKDKSTGEPLPGANVIVVGTSLGSAADLKGNYTVLHVPPGVYHLEIRMMGYAKIIVTNIRVRIDQTARVDVDLEMEAIEGETVTVVAEKNIIKKDVATSVVAVTGQEVEELPISNVQNIVGLQAGVEVEGDSLGIRGGSTNESLVLVDGVTLRDPRNNAPISSVALSSIREISIERGGFNAEYGQVRSGIVNIVTKEGGNAYQGSIEIKYSPPGKKYFGISPFDPTSNWLRPYYDDAVCWTGTETEGVWDYWTQRQYPTFEGWNAVSDRLMSDNDPTNDLSPVGAQQVFMWETRKQEPLDKPDYNIDAGFGGPVPIIGEKLGNLRFFTSFRKYREMLLVPLTRDDYVDYDWSLKLTSDISSSMKLTVTALTGKKFTMQENWSYNYLRYPSEIASLFNERLGPLFSTGHFSLADIGHTSLSAKLTHMLSQKTFYEVSLEHIKRDYYTRPPASRDKKTLYEIVPGYYVDEAPFGYDYDDEVGISGMLFGGFTCKRRDNSIVSATTLKADLTSQVTFSNLIKTGIELVYNNLDLDYGVIASYSDSRYEEHVQMDINPVRASTYIQDKMETKGFIMNLGLRLDYSSANTQWWDMNPYDKYFFSSKYDEDGDYKMSNTKAQLNLSPRLGISHPITENSKLFFNYGHFVQLQSYEDLFKVGRATDGRMTNYGDPNLTAAKTISYELGYDNSLFKNNFLMQLAAFYNDVIDQPTQIEYTSIGGLVYFRTASTSYRDTRGFELTLRKNRGRWWLFFANYTYQVSSSGNFGALKMYEDPSKQKEYNEKTTNLYQDRPIPSPYARASLSFYTPENYGPNMKGFFPLGGYTLNILLNWQAGEWLTWNPKSLTSVSSNIQRTDYFDSILRISKTFRFKNFRVQGFMDINNLFNYKRMSLANLNGTPGDHDYYYRSLHLPKSEAYDNIPGDDRAGSYRKEGVAYQPMIGQGIIDYETFVGDEGVIYYDFSTERYVEYVTMDETGTWQDVDPKRLNKILKDKAYIDMPNQDSFTFFNPRQIFFGIRLSFDFE